MIGDGARVEELMREARVCRIAWNGTPFPYVVPLSFAYDRGVVYFHCALEGEKLERLRSDPNVCVEVDQELSVRESDKACGWGLRYRSAIARGRAEILSDPQARAAALNLLMLKYSGRSGWEFSVKALSEVAVVAVRLSTLSGKESL
jgi:nitroimidazol reductase NimA-like FMN-containing flavoprotein (pyridoxamine 5'-phosphate oxidase superfamily)